LLLLYIATRPDLGAAGKGIWRINHNFIGLVQARGHFNSAAIVMPNRHWNELDPIIANHTHAETV
jgi:hypothetical protein